MTVFEHIIAGDLPASFVHVDEVCVAFMDINPMSPGHVLIVPRQPVATLAELDGVTRQHLFELAVRIGLAQQRALGSLAQHVLVNDGKAASQSVPHVHVHVVPRYRNDTLKALGHMLWHLGTLAFVKSVPEHKRQLFNRQAGLLQSVLAGN